MIFKLLMLQFKRQLRSSIWQKNLLLNIIYGFFMLQFVAGIVVLGYNISKIIKATRPDDNQPEAFYMLYFYFLAASFVYGLLLSEIKGIEIRYFRHLPIKRAFLGNVTVLMNQLSIANLMPLIFIVPFAIKVVDDYSNLPIAAIWALSTWLIFVTLSNFVIYIKQQLRLLAMTKFLISGGIILLLVLFFKFNEYSPAHVFAPLGRLTYEFPIAVLGIVMLYGLSYYLLYSEFLKTTWYKDIGVASDKNVGTDMLLPFLRKFGDMGLLLDMELKLILRHRRTKVAVFFGVIIFFYAYKAYNPSNLEGDNYFFLLFAGLLISGITMMNYGQFIPAWEGSHYSFNNLVIRDMRTWIAGKWLLLTIMAVFGYLLALPFAFIDIKILYVNTAMLFYNVGFTAFIILFFIPYNKKKIDLSNSNVLNWQGVGASQFIIGLPMFVTPYIVYLPFYLFDLNNLGLGIIAGIGLGFIVFIPYVIKELAERAVENKYALIEGYRQKD